jgi:SAM-dependent methyltransferase
MQPIPALFDRSLLKRRRQKLDVDSEAFSFLCQEVSERLLDRFRTFKRDFDICFQMGNDGGHLAKDLIKSSKFFILSDPGCLLSQNKSISCVIADEEFFPVSKNSLDLIISFLSLNSVNDIPGALTQHLNSLKPDGLFMAAFIGEDSLYELRSVFQQIEIERYKGISNRFMPLISTKDAGYLLGRAGFALPVTDMDRVVVKYPSITKLLQDLKITGNTSILMNRSHPPLSKGFLKDVESLYQAKFCHPEGGIQLTFDLVYMTGWRPAPNQQQPLKRGSAQQSLRDVL